jgi:hypothetical protein
MNHPGGHTPAFGGAVMRQAIPTQKKSGKIVRLPIELPCVFELARQVGVLSHAYYTGGETMVLTPNEGDTKIQH